jgi:hypothetical protein
MTDESFKQHCAAHLKERTLRWDTARALGDMFIGLHPKIWMTVVPNPRRLRLSNYSLPDSEKAITALRESGFVVSTMPPYTFEVNLTRHEDIELVEVIVEAAGFVFATSHRPIYRGLDKEWLKKGITL